MNKKKKVIIGISVLGTIALLSGITALIAAAQTTNIKSTKNIKTERIIDKLDSLLNNPINVANYDNMNLYTAYEALNNHQDNLKVAIKSVIKNQIQKDKNWFNNIYVTIDEVIKNITINLPSTISSTDSQIQGVILEYDGITLTNKTKSGTIEKTFIVDGFKNIESVNTQPTKTNIPFAPKSNNNSNNNNTNSNTNVKPIILNGTNVINVATYDNMKTYTASIALSKHKTELEQAIIEALSNEFKSNIISFDLSSSVTDIEILKNITIVLPQSVATSSNIHAQIPDVKLLYNGRLIIANTTSGKTNTFIVDGFDSTTLKAIDTAGVGPVKNGTTLDRSQQIANQLSAILNDFINVANYENMCSYTAATALNNANAVILNANNELKGNIVTSLQKAIISAVETDINKNIDLFVFEGVSYTANQIISGLTVILPTDISAQDNAEGQIQCVNLFYNSDQIWSNSSTGSYIIDGFKPISIKNTGIVDNRNKSVANQLGNLLQNSINVASYENMNLYSASEALQNEISLKVAIIDAIQNELYDSYVQADSVQWLIASAISKIEISLPKTATGSDIQDVKLSYMGFTLSTVNDSSNFTVTGFYTSSSTYNPSNEQIANNLSAFLQDDINISSNTTINSYTALSALYSYSSSLQTAVINSIESEITNFINSKNNINKLTLSDITKQLKVVLPSSISLIDDENAQIPNIILEYDGILLKSNNDSNSFVVNGFNNSKTNIQNDITSRSFNVAFELGEVLGDVISISNTNISSYTAAIVLNNHDAELKEAITNSIGMLIQKDMGLFVLKDLSYNVSEIINNITVSTPDAISISSDIKGEIQAVSLSYLGNIITGIMNWANESDTFIINGFSKTTLNEINTNYNRAQQVAKKLNSLLPQDINVSSYNNMNLYIASNALNNKPLLLKQAIISEIENIIQNNINQFIFEAVAYSTYEIGNNINITLPSSIPNNTISQISGIKISYYSYALTSSVNSKISDIFTITGFINAK